ncbi:hypothetical protein GGI25_003551 [Coemansia spiralis]|uniref:Uncharacterized protein n=2 Tax=Coemansia TaxID=4863 RepID=A0A9W8G8G4_9FUNG|nr:hypothetical protein EDC05_004085 [Coemansia umbellata]KAJ2622072.1 hypothetical protein GGI26_003514 [Coemansia sp. RSA 1358]KAJ2676516.1 hypothetical protein GGI25_003551 [Coemansia spiralis]
MKIPGFGSSKNKEPLTIEIELENNAAELQLTRTGCDLAGTIVIKPAGKHRLTLLKLSFLEHEYFEFGAQRFTVTPYISHTFASPQGRNAQEEHKVPFCFLLPENIHATVFTQYNTLRYELRVMAKLGGELVERSLEIFVCQKNYPVRGGGAVEEPHTHRLPLADVQITAPVVVSGEAQLDVLLVPHSPYYYLVGVWCWVTEAIEYTRTNGDVLMSESHTAFELKAQNELWHEEPIPLVDDLLVEMHAKVPGYLKWLRRELWATNTMPATPPTANLVRLDTANSHIRVSHTLHYKVKLWDQYQNTVVAEDTRQIYINSQK